MVCAALPGTQTAVDYSETSEGFTNWPYASRHCPQRAEVPHLVVDVSAMNRILHVDQQSLTVTVEAGITYWDLANQLREKGLAVENLSAYPGGLRPGNNVRRSR